MRVCVAWIAPNKSKHVDTTIPVEPRKLPFYPAGLLDPTHTLTHTYRQRHAHNTNAHTRTHARTATQIYMWNVSTMRPEPSEHHHSTIYHICWGALSRRPGGMTLAENVKVIACVRRGSLDASGPTGLFSGDDGFTGNKLNWSDYCCLIVKALFMKVRSGCSEGVSPFAFCGNRLLIYFSLCCVSFKCHLLTRVRSRFFFPSQVEPPKDSHHGKTCQN